jgi:hypothetical protein
MARNLLSASLLVLSSVQVAVSVRRLSSATDSLHSSLGLTILDSENLENII